SSHFQVPGSRMRSRAVRVTTTEGTGLEPVRACAQRFSRPPPYQLGLALPTANTELTRPRSSGKPVFSTGAGLALLRHDRAAGPRRIEPRRYDLVPATRPWQSDVYHPSAHRWRRGLSGMSNPPARSVSGGRPVRARSAVPP